MSGPALELAGVSFAYPGRAAAGLQDISLAVQPGELLAVIGPSGCGKSTLLKLIAGFLAPAAGRISLGGRDVAGLPPQRREIGIVFQSYALFPHMSVAENVAYPLKLRGQPKAQRLALAEAMLDKVGLTDRAGQLPPQLSGGQQQRVALARALVFRPQALLLDEPLSALDAALRVGLRDEIRRLQREHGIATLHITHDQDEALSMADRIAVMGQGRLRQIGTPREIYESPADAGIAAFVGRANLWPGILTAADCIETALGPLRLRPQPGYGAGQRAVALVRPERIGLGPAPDGVNGFAGRVAHDRYFGALRRFDLQVPGGAIAGETAAAEPATAVHVPPDAIRLLPPDETVNQPERGVS